MVWQQSRDEHHAHRWLRAQLERVCKNVRSRGYRPWRQCEHRTERSGVAGIAGRRYRVFAACRMANSRLIPALQPCRRVQPRTESAVHTPAKRLSASGLALSGHDGILSLLLPAKPRQHASQWLEETLLSVQRTMNEASGAQSPIVRVSMRHPPLRSAASYARIFNA
jgi:hypothetical protein